MTYYYTDEHEWIKVDGDAGTIGVSGYAANALGDIVHVAAPEVGDTFAKGDEIAVLDSVKTAAEVYAPVSCEVTDRNMAVLDAEDGGDDKPELLNEDPLGAGWICKVKLTDTSELSQLMDEDAYKTFCEGL